MVKENKNQIMIIMKEILSMEKKQEMEKLLLMMELYMKEI